MYSKKRIEQVDRMSDYYLARLTSEDAGLLKSLEEMVHLAFWGEENYRRFLDELPE